jgi:hypothetical protein
MKKRYKMVVFKNFQAAQRYAFALSITDGPQLAPHLAIYDIETDDIHAAIKAMNEFAVSGRMPLPESMGKSIVGAVYEEHGARVEAHPRWNV